MTRYTRRVGVIVLVVVVFLAALSRPVRAQIRDALFATGLTDWTAGINIGANWDVATPMPHDGVVDVFLYHKASGTAQIVRLSEQLYRTPHLAAK